MGRAVGKKGAKTPRPKAPRYVKGMDVQTRHTIMFLRLRRPFPLPPGKKMVNVVRNWLIKNKDFQDEVVRRSGGRYGRLKWSTFSSGCNNRPYAHVQAYGSEGLCPHAAVVSWLDYRVFTLTHDADQQIVTVEMHLAPGSSAGPAAEFARACAAPNGNPPAPVWCDLLEEIMGPAAHAIQPILVAAPLPAGDDLALSAGAGTGADLAAADELRLALLPDAALQIADCLTPAAGLDLFDCVRALLRQPSGETSQTGMQPPAPEEDSQGSSEWRRHGDAHHFDLDMVNYFEEELADDEPGAGQVQTSSLLGEHKSPVDERECHSPGVDERECARENAPPPSAPDFSPGCNNMKFVTGFSSALWAMLPAESHHPPSALEDFQQLLNLLSNTIANVSEAAAVQQQLFRLRADCECRPVGAPWFADGAAAAVQQQPLAQSPQPRDRLQQPPQALQLPPPRSAALSAGDPPLQPRPPPQLAPPSQPLAQPQALQLPLPHLLVPH